MDSSDGEEQDEDDDDDEHNCNSDNDDYGQYILDLLNKLDAHTNDKEKISLAQRTGNVLESGFSKSISKTTRLTLDHDRLMTRIQDRPFLLSNNNNTLRQLLSQTWWPIGRSENALRGSIQRIVTMGSRVHVFQENCQAETIDFKPKQRAQETRETMVDKFQVRTNFEKELEKACEEAGQQDEEAVLKAEEQIL